MNKKRYRLLLGAYLFAILAVSSIPGPDLPRIVILAPNELMHIIEYGILGFLAYKSFDKFSRSLLAGLFLFACIDEIWQLFTPGRCTSFFDVVIDMIGVCIVNTAVYFRTKKRS